jgi:hypothetical protein
MSADTNRSKTELHALLGNLADAVEHASPEDLLAEAKAAGDDTQQIASEVKSTLLDAVQSFEQRKLHTARAVYKTRTAELKRRRIVLPPTAAGRRRLLLDAATNNRRVAQVTARFRDLKELSDEDVESALEDLMELGAFDDTAGQRNDGNE